MYESFFGFHHRPFPAAPSLEGYFPADAQEAARRTLLRVAQRGAGPALLIGPPGVGKSLLLELLADELSQTCQVVRLSNGRHANNRLELLQVVAMELKLAYEGKGEGELRLSIVDHLLHRIEGPRPAVVLVDDAHLLSLEMLEELRQLSDVSRAGSPWLRPLLAGTSSLEERFVNPRLEAFNQRIAARCYLESMNREETRGVVASQVRASGGDPSQLFTAEAIEAVYRATDGVPRLINQLCDQALMLACSVGVRTVQPPLVAEAWAELQQMPAPWNHSPRENNAPAPTADIGSFTASAPRSSSAGVVEFGVLEFGVLADPDASSATAAVTAAVTAAPAASKPASHIPMPPTPAVLYPASFEAPEFEATEVDASDELEEDDHALSHEWRFASGSSNHEADETSGDMAVVEFGRLEPLELESDELSPGDLEAAPAALDLNDRDAATIDLEDEDATADDLLFGAPSVGSSQALSSMKSAAKSSAPTSTTSKTVTSSEEFEEEVVIDRYASLDARVGRPRHRVYSAEGSEIAALIRQTLPLAPAASVPVAVEPPAVPAVAVPSVVAPAAKSESVVVRPTVAPQSTESSAVLVDDDDAMIEDTDEPSATVGLSSHGSSADSDSDLIILEDDPHDAQAGTLPHPAISPVRRDEYRTMFARMRRANRA